MTSSTLFLVYVASLGSLSPVILATTTSLMCSGLLFLGQSQLQSCRLRPVGQSAWRLRPFSSAGFCLNTGTRGTLQGRSLIHLQFPLVSALHLCTVSSVVSSVSSLFLRAPASPVSRASFTPLSSGLEDCLLCLGHRHWAWHSSQSPFSNRD